MKTILIIEDDQTLRENTAELLELSDYKVYTAPNGKIGIDKALKHVPDIIICDIMMPEIDGYGVLESMAMSENTKHIPFIFLSARTKHKEIRKGMNMGADDYLTKPFEEEDLLKAIEVRLEKAHLIKKENQEAEKQKEDDENLQNLEHLRQLFCEEGERLSFGKGEIIFNKGDHSNRLYLILRGYVKTHIIDMTGKELITGLYKQNDFLGFTSFEDNIPYNETASALEDTEIVGLSKKYLRDLLQGNQSISLELMNLLTSNISLIKNQLMEMAYSSVRKKTASTIIQFVELMEHKPEMAIRISRNDLAANAGIAPESLIRTISEFRKRKLIEVEGRTIRILDLDSLQNMQ